MAGDTTVHALVNRRRCCCRIRHVFHGPQQAGDACSTNLPGAKAGRRRDRKCGQEYPNTGCPRCGRRETIGESGEIGDRGSQGRTRSGASESNRRDARPANRALLAGKGGQDSLCYKRMG